LGGAKRKDKKIAHKAAVKPWLLPFQMPTGLAVGLGLGSALSLKEYAPNSRVPRIHSVTWISAANLLSTIIQGEVLSRHFLPGGILFPGLWAAEKNYSILK